MTFISHDKTHQLSVFRSDLMLTNMLLVVIESKYAN